MPSKINQLTQLSRTTWKDSRYERFMADLALRVGDHLREYLWYPGNRAADSSHLAGIIRKYQQEVRRPHED